MKKNRIVKAALVLAAAMVFMTGCGNSKKAETTVETTAAKSAEELVDEASIKIGQYKGLSISREKAEVTDAEIEAELNYLASLYPVQVTGRPAKLGDVANIDYAGYKDGVAFAGGTAEGYNLTLGSGQFIDGFEDGVVGMEIGEERDLNLTFPEAYHSEELAGADVVFHVTLNSLSNADEVAIDDALAKKVMGDDEATLELLKADIRNDLMIQAESEYYSYGGAELINQIVENSEINVDPDAVEQMYNEMLTSYTAQAEMFGFTLEELLSYFYQMDMEQFEAYAAEIVKQEMIMGEIVRLENLQITDEQKDLMAKMNGFDDAAVMVESLGEESCENVFKIGVANFFLLDNAVYTGK